MHPPSTPEPSPRLQPAGRRWGFGAHSVVPYLTYSVQERPGEAEAEGAIRNPVFPQMENTLRTLRRRH